MKKRIAAVLVMGILVLTSCNPGTTEETTVMTVASETTPVATTTATTAAPTKAPTPKPTKAPTPTPTVVPETTTETTPVETTAAPTPKPTKAPVETTAATTTATTAAPTDPPPTTTAAPTYTVNPDAIRDLIIQYCVDNGRWTPDAETHGSGSVKWSLPIFFSDAEYANKYIEGKIAKSSWTIKSVSVWVEGNYLNIAHEEG